MKKLFVFLTLIFVAFIPVLAQPDAVPPDDLVEWVGRFPEMIGSFWGVYVSLLLLPAILFGVINIQGKALKYVLTGLIAVALIIMAHLINFGYLYEVPVWRVPLNWAFLMLTQILSYAVLKPLLDAIEDKFNKNKPTEPVG